jgi:hypothetical protein
MLSIAISSECAHSGKGLHLELDNDLNIRVADLGADPMVFVPLVDFGKLDDPSIIDAF